MVLLSIEEQNEKILEYIDEKVERIPLIKINRWAREKDIVEYMSKFGVAPTTTKRRLQEMVNKKAIQTKSWGGRRFYAPPTIPLPFLLSFILVSISFIIYYPITKHLINIGDIILIFMPIYMAIALFFLDKKVNNSGICIECGKSLNNGGLYCDKHSK